MKIFLCLLSVVAVAVFLLPYNSQDLEADRLNTQVTVRLKQADVEQQELINQQEAPEESISTEFKETAEPDNAPNSQASLLKAQLPGEDVEFKLQLTTSDFHHVEGQTNSTIGETLYKSRLLPSNEIELELALKQEGVETKVMKAYFDLANYEMELDGGDAVLNQDHKQLMNISADHLRHHFMSQYDGLEVPEHAFLLVQMLSYWSMAPEGFVYEKRLVQSR